MKIIDYVDLAVDPSTKTISIAPKPLTKTNGAFFRGGDPWDVMDVGINSTDLMEPDPPSVSLGDFYNYLKKKWEEEELKVPFPIKKTRSTDQIITLINTKK